MEKLVDIIGVEVLGDHRLRLTFGDGVVGEVGFEHRSWDGVFEPLRDPVAFAEVRSDPAHGARAAIRRGVPASGAAGSGLTYE